MLASAPHRRRPGRWNGSRREGAWSFDRVCAMARRAAEARGARSGPRWPSRPGEGRSDDDAGGERLGRAVMHARRYDRAAMARYDYRCRTCDERFEVERPMSAVVAPTPCPAGHLDTVRVLTPFMTAGVGSSS